MGLIKRNPEELVEKNFDIIVIGGGVYGAMILYEATRRGLRSLLLEKNDFCSGTSANNLRIIHGGLRYLQSANWLRFKESVQERRWFLKTFPELVEAIPCLMPLYGKGLKRRSIFRLALKLNDLLSFNRNRDVPQNRNIASARVISSKETMQIFPSVDVSGLKGGAVWFDGFMPETQRIVIETICRACDSGASAINYCKVVEINKNNNQVTGVVAVDQENAEQYTFNSKIVVNVAGPDVRMLASQFDKDVPDLFHPSIAWNLLFDRPPPSSHVLAISPPKKNSQMYFVVPWKGKMLVGTGHAPTSEVSGIPKVPVHLIETFVGDINAAIPGLGLNYNDILRIYAGYLPAAKEGTAELPSHEVIIDHAESNGPMGLYSVSGIKFTTARAVAEKLVKSICKHALSSDQIVKTTGNSSLSVDTSSLFDIDWRPPANDQSWLQSLAKIVDTESVIHLSDLILRRTNLGDNPRRANEIAADICSLFAWDDERCAKEISELKRLLSVEEHIV